MRLIVPAFKILVYNCEDNRRSLFLPEIPDPPVHIFPDIQIKQVEIADMIVPRKINKAYGKFRSFYKQKTIVDLRISCMEIDIIEFYKYTSFIQRFGSISAVCFPVQWISYI